MKRAVPAPIQFRHLIDPLLNRKIKKPSTLKGRKAYFHGATLLGTSYLSNLAEVPSLYSYNTLKYYSLGFDNASLAASPNRSRSTPAFRLAAPKSIRSQRWYRFPPAPTLLTSLRNLLFLFAAFKYLNAVDYTLLPVPCQQQ